MFIAKQLIIILLIKDKMCAEYLELFQKLVKDKKALIDKRNLPTIEVKDMVLLLLKTIYKKIR